MIKNAWIIKIKEYLEWDSWNSLNSRNIYETLEYL